MLDGDDVSFIYHNSEGDLRRVRRDIDKIKLKENQKKSGKAASQSLIRSAMTLSPSP